MQIMKGTYLVWVTPKWSSHLPFSLITHKFPPLYSSLSVPTFSLLQLSRKSFILFLSQGTGAWESALTNTLSPGDRIVSFLIGQFSLLWIDQQQRLNFNVDVVESDWGQGANLDVLESKLASDGAHTIKAICIVHNETATGVTNDLLPHVQVADVDDEPFWRR